MRVQAAIGMVLSSDTSELLMRCAVACHVLTGKIGIVVHKHTARLTGSGALFAAHLSGEFISQFDINTATDSLKGAFLVGMEEFFHAYRQDGVVHPRSNVQPSKVKGSRSAGTGILSVNDRNATDAHLTQDHLPAYTFLASNESGHRITHRRRFNSVFLNPCRA